MGSKVGPPSPCGRGLGEGLQRSASDQELAKVRGSDTTQMFMSLARKGMLRGPAALLTHGIGNFAVPLIERQLDNAKAARGIKRNLNPDLSSYPINRLGPP